MKKITLFIAIEILLLSVIFAQKYKPDHLSIAVTTMHTALPFGSFSNLFVKEFHPGFELGTGFNWSGTRSEKSKRKHDWFQTFQFGYSYQRWVQHSLVFYTQFGYRYKLPKGFNLETKLGGGYMRAIIATEVFSDGQAGSTQYGKITSGRSQAIINLGFNVNKQFGSKPLKVFLEYEQRLQTPFIQYYVSLLPYNYLKLGIAVSLHR
jgi:hypothetical protein